MGIITMASLMKMNALIQQERCPGYKLTLGQSNQLVKSIWLAALRRYLQVGQSKLEILD